MEDLNIARTLLRNSKDIISFWQSVKRHICQGQAENFSDAQARVIQDQINQVTYFLKMFGKQNL